MGKVTRQTLAYIVNTRQVTREELVELTGKPVYDVKQFVKLFDTCGFAAPFILVRRKRDKMVGTMMFQGDYYFDFKAEAQGLWKKEK